jgi:predicted deacylase
LQGRFNAADGLNFNRNYPDLFPQLRELLDKELGTNIEANRRMIRARSLELLAAINPVSTVDSMRQALLVRAIDADFVFDLHCDDEAVLHLYTSPSVWPDLHDLVDLLECPLVLLAEVSGGGPFDEASSSLWTQLQQAFPDAAIPTDMIATTIELRGQNDVDETFAKADALAIFDFMLAREIVAGIPRVVPGSKPAVHPMQGLARLKAPVTGVVTFQAEPGQWVEAGQRIATVYPLADAATAVEVLSPIDGLLYSRRLDRYVQAGLKLAVVSGENALPTIAGHTLLGD